MPTALITGSSRGIGLELAKIYVADGWHVLATCRDPKRAEALTAIDGDIDVRALDVTDHAAVDRLAQALNDTAIDHLILNAGISPQQRQRMSGAPLQETDFAVGPAVFAINVIGPLKMAQAFERHVARSDRKVMALVSSGGASLSRPPRGGNHFYRASKAALNMVMRGLSAELASDDITVVSLSPGWTRTDMGGPDADRAPEDAAADLRRIMESLTPADSGRFIHWDGTDIPF